MSKAPPSGATEMRRSVARSSQLVGFVLFLFHRAAAGPMLPGPGAPFFGHHIRGRARCTARRSPAACWRRAGTRSSSLAGTGCALTGAAGLPARGRALPGCGLARPGRAGCFLARAGRCTACALSGGALSGGALAGGFLCGASGAALAATLSRRTPATARAVRGLRGIRVRRLRRRLVRPFAAAPIRLLDRLLLPCALATCIHATWHTLLLPRALRSQSRRESSKFAARCTIKFAHIRVSISVVRDVDAQ